jgi:5-hydroxyisourate hydrolase-like protein (transthyretin family)
VAEDSGALNLTDIVVTDSDMGDMITATLTLIDPAAGTLNSSAGTYDPFTGVWTYTGTVTQVNTALANAMYTTAANWSGTTSITTHIEDAAHTGPAPGMITVNVTPVNDVPSATNLNQGFPAEFEDNPVSLTPIVVTDVDAATDLITAVMTLTTPGTGSLSSSGGWYAPGTGVWTMTGTVATVNSALASLTFLPASNWYGMVNITTHVEDAAHTGPANGNVSINITSVNDAPTAVSVGTIQTDIDPVDRVEIVLSADPGAPNESGQTLTFHIDDASNLHGTLYDSQFGPGLLGSGSDVALAAPGPGTLTVWYTPDAAYHGAASFSYYVWDDGPTGGPYDQNTSTSAMVSLQVGPLEGTSPPPYTPPPPTDSGTQQNPSTGTEPGSTVGETPSVTGGTGGTTGGSDGTQSVAGEPTLMVQQAAVIGATETQTSTDQALQTAQAQSETAAQEAAQRTAQEAAQQATQTPPPTGEAPPAGAVQTPGEVAAAGQQSTPGTPTGPGEGPSPGPAIGPATAGPPSIVTGALFVPPPLINPSQMSAPIFQATAGTLVAIDLGGTTPPPTFTLDEGSAPGRPRVETPAYAPSSSGTTITVDQTQTAVDNCTQSPASAPGAEGLFGQ